MKKIKALLTIIFLACYDVRGNILPILPVMMNGVTMKSWKRRGNTLRNTVIRLWYILTIYYEMMLILHYQNLLLMSSNVSHAKDFP